MDSDYELNPCPRCGSPPKIREENEHYWVECTHCPIRFGSKYGFINPLYMTRMWNCDFCDLCHGEGVVEASTLESDDGLTECPKCKGEGA